MIISWRARCLLYVCAEPNLSALRHLLTAASHRDERFTMYLSCAEIRHGLMFELLSTNDFYDTCRQRIIQKTSSRDSIKLRCFCKMMPCPAGGQHLYLLHFQDSPQTLISLCTGSIQAGLTTRCSDCASQIQCFQKQRPLQRGLAARHSGSANTLLWGLAARHSATNQGTASLDGNAFKIRADHTWVFIGNIQSKHFWPFDSFLIDNPGTR